jgi:hypothetical protein
MRDHRPVLET